MKICYLADSDNIRLREFMNYFALRHSISLITINTETATPETYNEFTDNYITVYPVQSGWFQTLRNILVIRKAIKQIKPNIIHAFGAANYGFYSAFSGFHPLIVTAHESDTYIKNKWERWRINTAFSSADSIFCEDREVSDRIAKMIRSRQEIAPLIIKNIQKGIDVNHYSPAMISKTVNSSFGNKIVTFSGGYNSKYDTTSLIGAISRVLDEVPDASFVFQLNSRLGQDNDSFAATFMNNTFRDPNVSSRVFFQGVDEYSIFNRILASAKVHVDLSLSGFGLTESVAEAMASGLPVIVTNIGENARWVQEGVGGYVTPLHNPEELARRIIHLLNDEDMASTMGKRNRKEMEVKYNYYEEMRRMENEYRNLYE
jgi:glycosyltransferase involved in cell wall biosynthesis